MAAEVVDLLDAYAERVARKLGAEPVLEVDAGQALYNALPRELQRTLVHLAFLMKNAEQWPPAELITSVARYHGAPEDSALCLMGWIPDRELSDTEARCLELSGQLALGLSFELEVGGPADLRYTTRRASTTSSGKSR